MWDCAGDVFPGAGWCVDSLGTSKQIGTGGTGAIPAGAVTVCP